ncbi:DUF5776 domain-containing protein [Apilactobacillus xinyiensis]|uniref:DUF5776 domain-containing protein n=1 Tax=Apilactobacillus xinyiensis TaxID=2841032 RepID=UPI001C7D6721|nr:DUF5776 domain-containing protein [Apilactobacillus xinyiensis]
MEYNKKFLRKINDKKVLKKVKKQWVTVSVATLAMLGTSALLMTSTNNVTAKADDTTQLTNNNQQPQQQGASDATNSQNAQSNASDTYKAAYQGASDAKSAYDAYATSNGTSSNYPSYNASSSSVNDGNANQSADKTNAAQTPNQSSPSTQSKGITPQTANNNATTTTDTQPADTTTNAAQTSDYTAQTSDAQKNAISYESSLSSSFNTSNTSVSFADKSNQNVSVPSADSIITSHKHNGNSEIDLAYKYGVNYFLANQGAKDARSGKWNGVSGYDNNNRPIISSYVPSSSDAYDQGYSGAQAAIDQQWNGDKVVATPITAATNNSSHSDYYQNGYNSTLDEINNSTAFVDNANKFNNAITAGIKNVKLTTDLNVVTQNTSKISSLNIDGQNHIIDMNNCNDSFNGNTPNLVIKNFRSIYAQNYYGAFSINGAGTINYSNVNYIGSQMLSATNNDVYFDGNVNAVNIKQYTSPFNVNLVTNGDNQQILDVNNFTLLSNAHFFGSTAISNGGNNIELSGNMNLQSGSTMNLLSRGKYGENQPAGNYAIYIKNPSSSLNLQKNANLNIVTTTSNNDKNNANGIYNLGSISSNGGNINIYSFGNSQNNNRLIYNNKNITIFNNGSINLHAANLGDNGSKDLIYNDGGNIYIVDQGNLNVSADGSGQVNLIYGKLNINNPGKQGVKLDLSQNTNDASTFHDKNSIVAYSTKVAFDTNTNALYQFKYDGSSATYVKNDGISSSEKHSIKSISFMGVPSVNLDNVSIDKDASGNTVLNGYVSINNYNANSKEPIYVQVATGSGDSYNQLTPTDDNKTSGPANDSQKYQTTIKVPDNYQPGQMIKVQDISVPSNGSFGVLMRYGVSGNAFVYNNDSKNYTKQVENISLNENKLSADNTDDSNNQPYINTDTGNYGDFTDGFDDGVTDANNNNQNALNTRNASPSDQNYHDAYDSAKAGYLAYNDNPSAKDADVPEAIQNNSVNESHPISYINGYKKARNDIIAAQNNGQSSAKTDISNNNKFALDTSSPTTLTGQAQQNAYNDVQNGWQAAAANATKPANPTAIYNDAYDNTNHGMLDAHQQINGEQPTYNSSDALYTKALNDYKAAYNDAIDDGNSQSSAKKQNGQNAVYNNVYDSANDGYKAYLANPIYDTTVHSQVQNNTASNPNAYVDGYKKAMNDIAQARQKGQQAAIDAINGGNYNLNNDSGLTSATDQARQAAYNDVQNGWKNGKQTARSNQNADNGNNPIYQAAYKDGYNGTMDSYQDILNSKTRDISGQPTLYQAAYKLANPQGMQDKNAALNDFKKGINNSKEYTGMDKVVYDKFYPVVYNSPVYQVYDNSKKRDGFMDATHNLANMDIESLKYNQDYQLGVNTLLGMKAAQSEHNLTASEMHNKPNGYVDGFYGYKDGYKLGANGYNYTKAVKNQAYDFAYANGYQAGQKAVVENATTAARKQARNLKPMTDLNDRSAAYINAYQSAYQKAINKLLPRYIYNRKAIYTHSKADFTNHNRDRKYAKTTIKNAKVLKVVGYKFDKQGHLRYKLANGSYVNADDSVANVYYTKSTPNANYKVIAKQGIHAYDDADLNNKVRTLKNGTKFKVNRVVNVNGVTRFYTDKGFYVTGNKKFVGLIK